MVAATAPYAEKITQSFRAARQRSSQSQLRELQASEKTVGVLRSARKPFAIAYIFLAVLALGLDVLDFAETPAAALGIPFVLQLLLEVGFFLLVKAMVGRGGAMSLFLIACTLFYSATAAITGPIFLPLLVILAFTNRNARVIQKSKEDLVGRLGALDQQITQQGIRVERLARTASRVSRRLGKASQAVRRARIAGRLRLASRRITKASRTINRALRNTLGNMLPVIELIPFQLWTVYGTYNDQKKVWQEAQELLVEYERRVAEWHRLQDDEAALQAAIASEVLSAHADQEQEAGEQEEQASEGPVARNSPAATSSRSAPPVRDIAPAVPVPAMG